MHWLDFRPIYCWVLHATESQYFIPFIINDSKHMMESLNVPRFDAYYSPSYDLETFGNGLFESFPRRRPENFENVDLKHTNCCFKTAIGRN